MNTGRDLKRATAVTIRTKHTTIRGNTMTTPITREQSLRLTYLGYVQVDADTPAIRCFYDQLDIYSAADWDSLVSHTENYQLCECGSHKPYAKDLSHECVDCGADVGVECSYNCSTNWI